MALAARVLDEQARWAPVWLAEIDPLGLNRRYATADLASLPHDGIIVNDPTVTRSLMDVTWGPVALEDVSVELANAGGALTADYLAGYEGKALVLKRYDAESGLVLAEWTGVITRAELGRDVLRLDGTNFDMAVFDELVPAVLVDTDVFALAAPADVGKAIQVIFGNVPQVPLLYVKDDKVNSVFVYMVGHDVMAVTGAYRNGPNNTLYPMVYSEFTRQAGGPATSWAEVARTDLFAGYTVVQPILRQTDFSGGLHRLYADVTGLQNARNFARAVRRMLTNVWGLNRLVNGPNFNAAEALLDPALVCDGAMLEQRPAREWLEQLLLVRGMRLATDREAKWTLTVDTQATTRALVAHDGTADGERTLLDVAARAKPPLADRCKDLVIKYRVDHVDKHYRNKQRRTVNAGTGRNVVKKHNFLRDHTAADRVADYLGKRLLYGQETVDVALTQEARALAVGDIVALHDPTIGYATPTDMEVRAVTKALTRVDATLQGWDEAIYTYTPGTLPTDPEGGTEVDESHTAPAAPTAFTLEGTGTRSASDGHVTAYAVLQFTNPASNWTHTIARYRVNGTGPWLDAGTTTAPGTTQMTVEALLPDTYYDFVVRAVNGFNLSNDSPLLLNQLMPSDPSIPDAPFGIGATQAGAKVVQVNISANTPTDWGTTRLYRNTVNNPNGASEIQQGKKLSFHDETVNYAQAYYYWARIEDLSGNISGFSPGTVITVQYHYGSDIGSNTITGGNVATGTIGTGNITSRAVTQSVLAAGQVAYTNTGQWVTVCSVSLSVGTDSYVLVTGHGTLLVFNEGSDPADLQATMALQASPGGGAGGQVTGGLAQVTPGYWGRFPASLQSVDVGHSGLQTYSLVVRYDGDPGGYAGLSLGAIQATEFKR